MLTAHPLGEVSPDWSPDGSRIAFVSGRDGNAEIYTILRNGLGLQRLTNNPARDNDPAWSPDGKRIAFVSDRDGPPDLYLMSADGSGVTRLTNTTAREFFPAWSPDGRMLTFDSNLDGTWQIQRINADGSGQIQLTSGSENGWTSWSPDGSLIAFASKRSGANQIYLMNTKGGNVTRLTNTDCSCTFPDWSPDGKYLVYNNKCSGNQDLFVMNADGSNPRRLTSDSADEYYARWSPVSNEPAGGLETVISDQPWMGQPRCLRDIDSDGVPDIVTDTYPPGEDFAYIGYLYGNQKNGTNFSASLPMMFNGRNALLSGYWEAGPAGMRLFPIKLMIFPHGMDFNCVFTLGDTTRSVDCKVSAP
jgi:TolB protein